MKKHAPREHSSRAVLLMLGIRINRFFCGFVMGCLMHHTIDEFSAFG
jgi:hypothetical protein